MIFTEVFPRPSKIVIILLYYIIYSILICFLYYYFILRLFIFIFSDVHSYKLDRSCFFCNNPIAILTIWGFFMVQQDELWSDESLQSDANYRKLGRTIVRSNTDKHVLFKVFKAYYPNAKNGDVPNWEHKHPELEISTIIQGEGIYHCGNVDYSFHPGDVFFHSGNDNHVFKHLSSAEPPALVVIRFDSRYIWSPGGEWFNQKYLQLFASNDFHVRKIAYDSPEAACISNTLNEIFEECNSQRPSYELMVKALLMVILANMARHFHDSISEPKTNINEHLLSQINSSINYILAHLSEEMTLDTLAKEACMSRSYYSSMFKYLNGLSVWDYITSHRIDYSKYLLETTNNTIIEISQNCGFNSIANFNRAFKKYTRKTPMEYRRQFHT